MAEILVEVTDKDSGWSTDSAPGSPIRTRARHMHGSPVLEGPRPTWGSQGLLGSWQLLLADKEKVRSLAYSIQNKRLHFIS